MPREQNLSRDSKLIVTHFVPTSRFFLLNKHNSTVQVRMEAKPMPLASSLDAKKLAFC